MGSVIGNLKQATRQRFVVTAQIRRILLAQELKLTELSVDLNNEESKNDPKLEFLGTFGKTGLARCAHHRDCVDPVSTAYTRYVVETPSSCRKRPATPAPHDPSHLAHSTARDQSSRDRSYRALSRRSNSPQPSRPERRPRSCAGLHPPRLRDQRC